MALHEACEALYSGAVLAAVVAGVNMVVTSNSVAPSSFERTNGDFTEVEDFVPTEAVSAVYIKKLEGAIRDGNPIRGIIRSTTISKGNTYEGLIRKSYDTAGVDLRNTALVEVSSSPISSIVITHRDDFALA